MAMVKAFAYGSGSVDISRHLETEGIDYLGVAIADEGVELRQNGISMPIMIMNPVNDTFETLWQYRLEPSIYSLSQLEALSHFSKQKNIENLSIHLKIDTGMNRLGFKGREVFTELLRRLAENRRLHVGSLFTHLSATDEEQHDAFTCKQVTLLEDYLQEFTRQLGYRPLRHALNTSGAIRFPEYAMDMVRLGIGMYGIAGGTKAHLENVCSFKSYISQIKEVTSQETVGYGRIGKLPQKGEIAILPVGYADGLNRLLGNGIGQVSIQGKKYPFVGNICMDLSMVYLGEERSIQEGEEVTLFETTKEIEHIAQQTQTIPYEVLTSISARVKRVYCCSAP